MPTPSLSSDKRSAVLGRIAEGFTNRQIAKMEKVAIGTVSHLRSGRGTGAGKEFPTEPGMPVDTRDETTGTGETTIVTPDKPLTLKALAKLFGVDLEMWEPVSFTTNIWNGFYKIKTKNKDDHRKVALFQTRCTWKRVMTASVEGAIKKFAKEHVRPIAKGRLPLARGGSNDGSQMAVVGLHDVHLGLYSWKDETGENMDLNIGVNRLTNAIDDLMSELSGYPIGQLVLPIGNDMFHVDHLVHRTMQSENPLDADGRYARVYGMALLCMAYCIERALEIAPKVHVPHIPGNHDAVSSLTLTIALSQRYLLDKRVTFDCRPATRKYVSWGGSLIGFEHGQDVPPQRLAMIFSTEAKELWGKATWREIMVGHTHQRREKSFEGLTPLNGVLIRTLPSLAPADAWHHAKGYTDLANTRAAEAYRYDRRGFRGSHAATARDDRNDAAKGQPLFNAT